MHVTFSDCIIASASYSSQTPPSLLIEIQWRELKVYFLLYLHINFYWEIQHLL